MKNEGALRMRFLRYDGIYRSDVSSLLFTPGACPAFRSGRCQGIGQAGKNLPCPSSAMSSGRLFLDGLLASIARLRFTGWFPCCAQRPKQSSTTEQSKTGIFDRRNNFLGLDTKKFLPEHRSARYNNSCPGFRSVGRF